MTNTMKLGSTVCLYNCPTVDGKRLNGLYLIVEFNPYEPSNYVWSPFYTLDSVDGDFDNPNWVDVDAMVLLEQVDPIGYGKLLEQEREMEFAEEDRDRMGFL